MVQPLYCLQPPSSSLQPPAYYLLVLGSALPLGIGAIVLWKILEPSARIEGQLRRLAEAVSLSQAGLRPVEPIGPTALGWNRIVEDNRLSERQENRDARLTKGLNEYRQKKAEAVLSSLPDGLALTDQENRVTFVNQALTALLSSAEDIRGKPIEECLDLSAAGEQENLFSNDEFRSRSVVAELTNPSNMSQGVYRVARHPLRLAEGNSITGHLWTVRDITQQKLADQMRSQFVHSAAHELRTPLANIKAYSETLATCEIPDVEQQKEFCNTINAEATRLARFIDDLLSISRMEAGALMLERQVTDMRRMLGEVIKKVRAEMEAKGLDFETDLPEKLPEMNLDKDKLTVTLVNLLGNAAKYTPEGGQVTFRVEVRDGHLKLAVIDTGIGISVAELPKIFDKFFRCADPRVQECTGSGLGLSLVGEIVRLHGGRISVNSELDKGTTICVTLPLG